jgi:hypothetical protein
MDTNEIGKDLIRRLRVTTLPWADHISEKKMFGGPYVLYKGKMSLGETKGRLGSRGFRKNKNSIYARSRVPYGLYRQANERIYICTQPGF